MFRKPVNARIGRSGEAAKAEIEQKIHMDLGSDTAHLPTAVVLRRAALFFGWLLASWRRWRSSA